MRWWLPAEIFRGAAGPLCAYPKHAQYSGQGDPNEAKNFTCRE